MRATLPNNSTQLAFWLTRINSEQTAARPTFVQFLQVIFSVHVKLNQEELRQIELLLKLFNIVCGTLFTVR